MDDSRPTITWRVDGIDFYIVALLDVLGQSQKLIDLDYLPTNDEEQDLHDQGIQNALRPILQLRHRFLESHRRAVEIDRFISERRLEQHLPGLALPAPVVKFMPVGDAVVAHAPAFDQEGHLNLAVVFAFFSSCAECAVSSLETGTAVRGAVEIGAGFLLPDGDLYGPAISKVHSMENRHASYPRVLIGPALRASLDTLCHAMATAQNKDDRVMATECWQMTFIDDDDCCALDYLAGAFVEAIELKGPWQHARLKAAEFVRAEKERFQREGNGKLVERYTRLAQYFALRGL